MSDRVYHRRENASFWMIISGVGCILAGPVVFGGFIGGMLCALGLVLILDGVRDARYRLVRRLESDHWIAWRTPAGEVKRAQITGKEWVNTMGEYRITALDKSGTVWMVWEHSLV